ncbi:hypothetical protein BC834DRAFT_804013, partial [Gloeopeniophorella convolvens]
LKADIIGVDKQDDRAAARLFSSAAIEYSAILPALREEHGLKSYLFVIGDVFDAQQNRVITHAARIKMLWRGRFFLDGWRNYILMHPHYNISTHFISRELYDILSVFINAMLSLILAHRDYFPHVPLLLWLNSTEVCEHFFGCTRKVQKDFTFVEWIMMIPKLATIMSNELKLKGFQASAREHLSRAHRSGYYHSWSEMKGLNPEVLMKFPSNQDINLLIRAAYLEAKSLITILGMELT